MAIEHDFPVPEDCDGLNVSWAVTEVDIGDLPANILNSLALTVLFFGGLGHVFILYLNCGSRIKGNFKVEFFKF